MLKEEKRDKGRAQRSTTTTGSQATTTTDANTAAPASRISQKAISYAAERVIGTGSFGVVYQASTIETRETVAIKKVLQDQRYKNRELQIMSVMNHPCVVGLKHCFYSTGDVPNELYLNLVMEFIPDTIYKTLRHHTKAKRYIHSAYVCCFMYQILRSVAYIHSLGICHRDIKPQNLLLNSRTHLVKLCDFGSAKKLIKSEPNVAYICSRYYRAPELVCEARDYTTAVDIWSVGCVFAELLLGVPIFPGDSSADQLTEIMKILGTPTQEDIIAMKPGTRINVSNVSPLPWERIFRDRASKNVIDLISKLLCYNPTKRIDPFDALAHPYFDELRKPNHVLPDNYPAPNINNWTDKELILMRERGLTEKLIPPHIAKTLTEEQLKLCDYQGKIGGGTSSDDATTATAVAKTNPTTSSTSSSSSSSNANTVKKVDATKPEKKTTKAGEDDGTSSTTDA